MMWTEKGRVVYERPKHFFEAKDCIRILKKLDQDERNSFFDLLAEVDWVYQEIGQLAERKVIDYVSRKIVQDVEQMFGFMDDAVAIIPVLGEVEFIMKASGWLDRLQEKISTYIKEAFNAYKEDIEERRL